MRRYDVCSGSKTISIASAWLPWFRYVASRTSPPAYPTRVERTPGCRRKRTCNPQKQPPARIAFSTSVLMLRDLLARPGQEPLYGSRPRLRWSGDATRRDIGLLPRQRCARRHLGRADPVRPGALRRVEDDDRRRPALHG